MTKALEREEEALAADKIPKKVTRAQIAKEMTHMRGGYGGGPAKAKDAKMVTEQQQEKILDAGGKNRDGGQDVDASGVKDATEQLAQLQLKQDVKVDEHPERRMKAAHLAFEGKMIPRLKAENPGLKHSQIKEMVWKEWQKSPENPMVQQMMRQMAERNAGGA